MKYSGEHNTEAFLDFCYQRISNPFEKYGKHMKRNEFKCTIVHYMYTHQNTHTETCPKRTVNLLYD